MKTSDNYTLKEGDECWLICRSPETVADEDGDPIKATFIGKNQSGEGWDFEVTDFRTDIEIEILSVWKIKPKS